jgi:hypothetical protein
MSYGSWRRRFASDPGILGKTLNVNDENWTVIGVMPDGFEFVLSRDVWIPFAPNPDFLDHKAVHPSSTPAVIRRARGSSRGGWPDPALVRLGDGASFRNRSAALGCTCPSLEKLEEWSQLYRDESGQQPSGP